MWIIFNYHYWDQIVPFLLVFLVTFPFIDNKMPNLSKMFKFMPIILNPSYFALITIVYEDQAVQTLFPLFWCLILNPKLKFFANSILFCHGQSLRPKRHVNKHILRSVGKKNVFPIGLPIVKMLCFFILFL